MTSDGAAPPVVKLSLPLEYQQEIFNDLSTEDELVVIARGLGLLRLVTNLLHAHDAAGNNLIVLVGADERDNELIIEALAEQRSITKAHRSRGLTLVKTDLTNVAAREDIYARGGILTITSQILVVDLLSQLLEPTSVTGMVVLHAERITATSLEAFIIRLYRQKNKSGFLKAFSDAPEPFASGFAPLATSLRNLFLQKSSIWPRFQLAVARSLEGPRKAEVVEFEVPLTDNMRDIQNAVLECVEASISELRKAGTGIELDDWTVDHALHRNFDVIVRRQLDAVWHRISFRTRQIVNDLTVLRGVLHALLAYDAVSFNKYLDTIRAAHQPPPGSTRHDQSPWLFLDAANTIFATAKQRVYTSKASTERAMAAGSAVLDDFHLVLEELPKWKLLAEVLEEIERDAYFNPVRDDSNGTILVMCSEKSTCRQLREYMSQINREHDQARRPQDRTDSSTGQYSASLMMRRKFKEYLEWKSQFARVSAKLYEENQKALEAYVPVKNGPLHKGRAPPNKRRRVRGGGVAASQGNRAGSITIDLEADSEMQPLSILSELQAQELDQATAQDASAYTFVTERDTFEIFEPEDSVIIHPFDGDMDDQLLDEIQPRYVIMYDPDAAFVRRIEVYRSSHTYRTVKVYWMYYKESVEEQRYLTTVRKEKDAFTRLIKERANMALSLNHNAIMADPQEQFLRTVNTRIAGGGRLAATAAPPVVVVDVREFRSSLPSLLHGRSMYVVPVRLTVADYILSPTICIERKSVRDLISSFKSGRLFNQAEVMLQHYKHPMLLIEFDQNKSFTLDTFAEQTKAAMPSVNPTDIQSKLVMLTIAFPKLKIIWSSSPYQTAEIFEELKKNQDEPVPEKAVLVGIDDRDELGEQSFNQTPHDMLRAVPGITGKNISRISLEVDDLQGVTNLSGEQLNDLVGNEAGRQIHRFFNHSMLDE